MPARVPARPRIPPLAPIIQTNSLHITSCRAFGNAEDDFAEVFAPAHGLLSALDECCPNLEVLSCRGCDLDARTTLSALNFALKPSLYLPRPTPADVLDAESRAGPAIGPILQPSFSHPCPFPHLRLLDLRMNWLDMVLHEQEEEEGDDEFGSLRRCLEYRQWWAQRWNELQHKGKDGRVASLTVLV